MIDWLVNDTISDTEGPSAADDDFGDDIKATNGAEFGGSAGDAAEKGGEDVATTGGDGDAANERKNAVGSAASGEEEEKEEKNGKKVVVVEVHKDATGNEEEEELNALQGGNVEEVGDGGKFGSMERDDGDAVVEGKEAVAAKESECVVAAEDAVAGDEGLVASKEWPSSTGKSSAEGVRENGARGTEKAAANEGTTENG